MSFLAVTIPISLLLGIILLALVIARANAGDYEDWEGPAARMSFDDDSTPERAAGSHAPGDRDVRTQDTSLAE